MEKLKGPTKAVLDGSPFDESKLVGMNQLDNNCL